MLFRSDHGVDAVRLAMVFAGPREDDIDWRDVSPAGARKFLARAWRLAGDVTSAPGTDPSTGDLELRRATARHGVPGEIIVAIDTSGSIDVSALSEFASNVVAICEDLLPAKLTIIYWDAVVQRVEEYEPGDYGNLIYSTRPAGGGGTVPTCIKDYITENDLSPEALLIFTDGVFYGDSVDFGDIPTLWCLDQNYYKHFIPPCGSAVEILI